MAHPGSIGVHGARAVRALLPATIAAVLVSGCALLGLSSTGQLVPPSPALQPPTRWERRFCEAQEWVAVARVRMNQARTGIGRTQDREVLEDLGDDAADTANRALAFLAVVPDWPPGADLLGAERTMLRRALRAGDLLERIAITGPVTPDRLRPARLALGEMADAMEAAAAAGRQARDEGIPCAIPMLAPLVPPEVGDAG